MEFFDHSMITLKVFTPKSGMKQIEAPVDIHGCNAPATRRQKIIETLLQSPLIISINEVVSPIDGSLEIAKCVHDDKFIEFLESAWHKWKALEDRCTHFFGTKSAACDIPSLLPGNYINRDACQIPGQSVYSQACYYQADNEAPIFEALHSALVDDMYVVKAVLDAFDNNDTVPATAAAYYALVTHPGHHAGRSNCSGYCYINSAAGQLQLHSFISISVTLTQALSLIHLRSSYSTCRPADPLHKNSVHIESCDC